MPSRNKEEKLVTAIRDRYGGAWANADAGLSDALPRLINEMRKHGADLIKRAKGLG